MTREITITEAEGGFVVTGSWDRLSLIAIGKLTPVVAISVVDTPMSAAKAVYSFFYDDEYEEPYILEKVPERLEYKVREFIRNNPE